MARAGAGGLRALAFGALLAFAAGEIGLRVWHRVAAGTPFLAFLPGWHQRTFPLSPFLVFGPRVDWQLEGKASPETSYWNAQGFRTHETLGPRPPGEVRVIALGGSTTEDVWNDAGIHWPLVVEERIHAAGRDDVRVYNAAMSAYTTAHTLVQLELDVLPYQPDLVLVMHNVNDLLVVYSAATQGRPLDSSYHVKYAHKSLTGYKDESDVVVSRLVSFVRDRWARLFPPPPRPPLQDYDLQAGLRIFERNLRSTIAVARANGAEVVLVTMPASRTEARFEVVDSLSRQGLLDSNPSHERFLEDFDRYNDAVRRVGAECNAPVIDAAALLPADDALFADLVHTTTAGVRAMGDVVAAELLPLLPARRDTP